MSSRDPAEGYPSVTELKTLIIVPAWNEEEIIAQTVSEIQEKAPQYDLLVVNDGSTDNTLEILQAQGVDVLNLPFNMGVGAAMRAGFLYAAFNDYDQVIQVDSDGQHNPEEISAVLEGLQEADIAIGARFSTKGDYVVRGPRKWAMKLLSFTVSKMSKVKLTDITSGFKAANRKALQTYIEYYPAEFLGDTVDSLVHAIKSGCKVVQVPVAMRERQGGTASTPPWKAAFFLLKSLVTLSLALTKSNKRRS